MRVGFRVDNENKAQINLDIVDENLLGTGTELGFLLSGGTRTRSYILEQKSNRIFDTYLTYKLNAFYKFNDVNTYANVITGSDLDFSRQKNGEYRQIFYGGAVSVGTQVQRFGNLIFEGKYQVDQVKNLSRNQVKPYKTKILKINIRIRQKAFILRVFTKQPIQYSAAISAIQNSISSTKIILLLTVWAHLLLRWSWVLPTRPFL